MEDDIQFITKKEMAIGKEQKILGNNQILLAKDKAIDLQELKAVSSFHKK